MRKRVLFYLIIFCCVTALGCAKVQPFGESDDELILPIQNYQDALEPEIQFLGKVEGAVKADWHGITRGAPLESESVVYGHIGSGNVVEKALIVRTYKIRGESDTLLPDLMIRNKHLLDSGTVEIASKRLIYKLLIDQGGVGENEKKLISDKGLVISGCYLLKAYSGKLTGVFEKSKSHILYFERIDAGQTGVECRELIQTEGTLLEMGKPLINNFTAKADACVGKLLGVETDVERVAGEQTSKKTDDAAPFEGTSVLERKLNTLKNLLDKGLITQDDYDRKKLKLLEDF